MPSLNGYLSLTAPDGRCFEIGNQCRTIENMSNGKKAHPDHWRQASAAKRCCCWAHNDVDQTEHDPWFDPLNPATEEVAGILFDQPSSAGGFWLQSPLEEGIFRSSGTQRLELRATFTVVSSTKRGELAWLQWFQQIVSDCCRRCDGWSATVFAFCPCEDDFELFNEDDELLQENGAPTTDLDPCDENPELLVAAEDWVNPLNGETGVPVADVLDDGSRQLLQVRFIGLNPLFDRGGLFECAGNRYEMIFEVVCPVWYSRTRSVCELGGAGTWDDCQCRSCRIVACDSLMQAAQVRCAGQPVGNAVRSSLGSSVRPVERFKQPWCFSRQTCLTAPQPTSITQQAEIVVTNPGLNTVRFARLWAWAAAEGVADPYTVQGSNYYDSQPALVDLRINELGPGESVVLPRGGAPYIECATGQRLTDISKVLEGPSVSSQLPSLSCSQRYWFALDLPCDPELYGDRDLEASVRFAAVEIPA